MAFTIVGGTYRELCRWPEWDQLYGSGLRGAIVCSGLSNKQEPVKLITWCSEDEEEELEFRALSFNIKLTRFARHDSIEFQYEYPTARPFQYPDNLTIYRNDQVKLELECGLVFGTLEATPKIEAKKIVWDPQAGARTRSFDQLEFQVDELAVVLNRTEAFALLGVSRDDSIRSTELAKQVLEAVSCALVVVKDGPCGAWLATVDQEKWIPSYRTQEVFSIGSGDVFSAAFAWGWLQNQFDPAEAADFASRATAHYCSTRTLPLPELTDEWVNEGPVGQQKPTKKKVYLAGPFFNVPERWFARQVADHLRSMGIEVFSPFEDVGFLSSMEAIAESDLAGLQSADALFLIADGFDAGSLFEAGFATAMKKQIFVYAERSRPEDLTMLLGTNAKWFTDLSSALYSTVWALNGNE